MAEIIKIGRNHDSKKLLTNPQDPTVSKLHLQLFIDDDYNVFVSDLNSSNGTYVNNNLIKDSKLLEEGDMLSAGNCIVKWSEYIHSLKNLETKIEEENDDDSINKSDEISLKENSKIFKESWNALSGYWGVSIGFMFVYLIVGCLANFISYGIITVIITGALSVGSAIFNLNISRKNEPKIENLFYGFNSFLSSLLAFWAVFVVVFLGMCLLVIPGIYWGLGYAMTFFFIADNPKISGLEAMSRSNQIMDGNRWKLLRFQIRAMILVTLGCIPLGLGLFIVIPWIYVAYAKFYEDLVDGL
tara:strand:+ start:632 stop:1531 length:900 start_codon:yes stop_codon:yes gene_type:complete